MTPLEIGKHQRFTNNWRWALHNGKNWIQVGWPLLRQIQVGWPLLLQIKPSTLEVRNALR